MGEEGTKQQEDRWVVKKSIFDTGRGCPLFGGIVRGLVVGEFRRTGVGQAPSRIEADEIGARGGVERYDQTMSACNQKQKAANFDRKKDRAICANATIVQRIAQRAAKTQLCRHHRRYDFRWMPEQIRSGSREGNARMLERD